MKLESGIFYKLLWAIIFGIDRTIIFLKYGEGHWPEKSIFPTIDQSCDIEELIIKYSDWDKEALEQELEYRSHLEEYEVCSVIADILQQRKVTA